MLRWDLTAQHEGARTGPQVLFSTPEARAVLVELADEEELGDHRVHERTIVQVVRGGVTVTRGTTTASCAVGTLIAFDPGETHSVRGTEPTRLLLMLAPWPASDHYETGESEDPHELPVNATGAPLEDPSV